jgi:hypothetical protein
LETIEAERRDFGTVANCPAGRLPLKVAKGKFLRASPCSPRGKAGYRQIHGWGDEAIRPLLDIKKGNNATMKGLTPWALHF